MSDFSSSLRLSFTYFKFEPKLKSKNANESEKQEARLTCSVNKYILIVERPGNSQPSVNFAKSVIERMVQNKKTNKKE